MMFSRKNKNDVPGRRLTSDEPRPTQTSSQFRRNRTLSGVRPKTEETSARSKTHHLTQQRRKIGGILLIVLAVVVLLTILLTQLTARVIIAGSSQPVTSRINADIYAKAINDYLGTHPAGRLRFMLNEEDLSNYAAAATPEVLSVEQSGSDHLVETRFSLTFRRPVAGWQINSHQYFVDDQGVVFEKNYYDTPSVRIVDESGVSPEQGSTVASARLLSFVGRVVALSKSGGYEVAEAILPSGTTRQVEIRLKDVAPLVKLTIDRGAGEQSEDMIRSLNYLRARGQAPGYVDVRVTGRTVYQ